MTSIRGTFTLGDVKGVEKLFEDEGQKYVLEARSEAIVIIDEMKKLIQKGLSPETAIYIWGKEIQIKVAPDRSPVEETLHSTMIQVLLDESEGGKLKKEK